MTETPGKSGSHWKWLASAVVLYISGCAIFAFARGSTYTPSSDYVLIPGKTIASKQPFLFHFAGVLFVGIIVLSFCSLAYFIWRWLGHHKWIIAVLYPVSLACYIYASIFLFAALDLISSNHWLSRKELVSFKTSPSGFISIYFYTTAKGSCFLYKAKKGAKRMHFVSHPVCGDKMQIEWLDKKGQKIRLKRSGGPPQEINLDAPPNKK